MKQFFFALIFSLMAICGYAQQAPIMVCNSSGTVCMPYYVLTDAVTAALPGSYIYVPGGSFSLGAIINKELHFIGAGHYPDSTHITGVSSITGTLTIDTGCSNSSFEGLYISHVSVPAANGGGIVNNISFTRCNIPNLYLNNSEPYVYSYSVSCNSSLFKDCVFNQFMPLCTNCTINNCILTGGLQNINSSTVNNCVIFSSFYYNPYGGGTSGNNIVKNNIFDSLDITGSYLCSSCILTNNLTTSSSLSLPGATLETGTMVNVPISNLFANATTVGFDYTKDFHLKSTSPGHNAGDDGTDVGIYGSGTPYAPDGVPSNPHFYYQSVSGITDTMGNLPVHIKVRASY